MKKWNVVLTYSTTVKADGKCEARGKVIEHIVESFYTNYHKFLCRHIKVTKVTK